MEPKMVYINRRKEQCGRCAECVHYRIADCEEIMSVLEDPNNAAIERERLSGLVAERRRIVEGE